jgi:hypothetical protein
LDITRSNCSYTIRVGASSQHHYERGRVMRTINSAKTRYATTPAPTAEYSTRQDTALRSAPLPAHTGTPYKERVVWAPANTTWITLTNTPTKISPYNTVECRECHCKLLPRAIPLASLPVSRTAMYPAATPHTKYITPHSATGTLKRTAHSLFSTAYTGAVCSVIQLCRVQGAQGSSDKWQY